MVADTAFGDAVKHLAGFRIQSLDCLPLPFDGNTQFSDGEAPVPVRHVGRLDLYIGQSWFGIGMTANHPLWPASTCRTQSRNQSEKDHFRLVRSKAVVRTSHPSATLFDTVHATNGMHIRKRNCPRQLDFWLGPRTCLDHRDSIAACRRHLHEVRVCREVHRKLTE